MQLGKFGHVAACLLMIAAAGGCTETRELRPNLQAATSVPNVPPAPTSPEAPQTRPADAWQTNEEALKIIQDAEGLRLRAYRLAGQWLIGYGHAVDEPEDVVQDLTITEHEAERLLRTDVAECEAAVRRSVKIEVTQNQFSALVAFCYNLGQSAFAKSRILRHLNGGEEVRAADAFLLYDHARMEDEKVKVASLTERRIKERYLFLAS